MVLHTASYQYGDEFVNMMGESFDERLAKEFAGVFQDNMKDKAILGTSNFFVDQWMQAGLADE